MSIKKPKHKIKNAKSKIVKKKYIHKPVFDLIIKNIQM